MCQIYTKSSFTLKKLVHGNNILLFGVVFAEYPFRNASVKLNPSADTLIDESYILTTVTGRNPNNNVKNTNTNASTAAQSFEMYNFCSTALTNCNNQDMGNGSRSSLAPNSLASL